MNEKQNAECRNSQLTEDSLEKHDKSNERQITTVRRIKKPAAMMKPSPKSTNKYDDDVQDESQNPGI